MGWSFLGLVGRNKESQSEEDLFCEVKIDSFGYI